MVARIHGHRHPKQTKTYTAWINMKMRCTNPNMTQFKDWGGRGITYDPRWEDFLAFLEDMGEAPPKMTLDREDNDQNYNKKNCRWVSAAVQRRNGRRVRYMELDGETVCLKDYCAVKGINYPNVRSRLHRGWPLEKAMVNGRFHRFRNEAIA